MPYVSPMRAPERILIYGEGGSRKSSAILQLAKKLPEVKFRVVECDWSPSMDVFLSTPEYADLDNIEYRTVFPDDFDGQLELLQWQQKESRAGDWAAFDSFTHTWDASSQWFIEHQFGEHEDADAYYLSRRAEKTGKEGDLDGWMDWPYIKKIHNKLYREIAKCPANYLMTMEQTATVQDRLAGEEKSLFGRQQFMPRGRKQIAHVPRTIIHFEVSRDGVATYSSLKDRTRQLQTGHANNDFFRDYLVPVAGWHLQAADVNGPSDPIPQPNLATADGEA